MAELHQPAMVEEVLRCLLTRSDGFYLDGTAGTGGHAEAILRVLGPGGRLLCLDMDPDVLEVAQARLGAERDRVFFHRGDFSELDAALAECGEKRCDGILLDLGLNSWSLAQPAKGLSYSIDGPLRMDCDPDLEDTAERLLASASEDELIRIFSEYGDVRRPHQYAGRVAEARRVRPLHTTFDLVRALSGRRSEPPSASELSRIFMALRVAVGREMERLERFLSRAADWIRPDGRLVILSYAGHEDRRLKSFARLEASAGRFQPLTKKPIHPQWEEVRRNSRARSARLRCFIRGGNHVGGTHE